MFNYLIILTFQKIISQIIFIVLMKFHIQKPTMESVRVGRRAFCAEAFLKERVEREAMRILALVRSNYPENG